MKRVLHCLLIAGAWYLPTAHCADASPAPPFGPSLFATALARHQGASPHDRKPGQENEAARRNATPAGPLPALKRFKGFLKRPDGATVFWIDRRMLRQEDPGTRAILRLLDTDKRFPPSLSIEHPNGRRYRLSLDRAIPIGVRRARPVSARPNHE